MSSRGCRGKGGRRNQVGSNGRERGGRDNCAPSTARARMLLDSNHGRTQTTAKSTPLQKDRNTEGQPVPNCGYRQAKFEVDPQLVANTPTSSMDAFVNLSRRGRASKPSLTSTWMTAVVTVVALTTNPVKGADISTDYLKPAVSSKACVETAELIAAKTASLGNDGACLQCDPANKVCPPGCQALVDDLYVNCDGVTTPDGLCYDPDNSIKGEWSANVKAAIKIATERCGCDQSVRIAPLAGTIFGTSTASGLGLVVLTSLVSLLTAHFFVVVPEQHR